MKRPAIFFDRDNTLIVGNEYLGDPAQVQLMPGAAECIARARKLGFATVVVSNQSGVARGFFDEETVKAVNHRMEDLLLSENVDAIIDRHEYCPFHPQGTIERYAIESDLRKPKPGMIYKAAHALALDLSNSWLVGDAPRDIEAGAAAGCKTILFLAPDLPASPAALEQPRIKADFVVSTLGEAIDFIEKQRNGQPTMKLVPAEPVPETPEETNDAEEPEVKTPEPVVPKSTATATSKEKSRTDTLLEQILAELRKPNEGEHVMDFSVSKLLAGIVQIVAIAVAFLAFLFRNHADANVPYMLIMGAQFAQLLTIALLIMGRQK